MLPRASEVFKKGSKSYDLEPFLKVKGGLRPSGRPRAE